MSFSVCKLAETRRNLERERERNSPAGLICLVFCCFNIFLLSNLFAATCPDHHSQNSYNDSWGSGIEIVEVVSGQGSTGFTHCNPEVSSSTDSNYRMRISYPCDNSSSCVSSDKWYSVVRQKDKTTCSAIDFQYAYHLEHDLTNSDCEYECVKGLKACGETRSDGTPYFGRRFPDGNLLSGYKEGDTVYNWGTAPLLDNNNVAVFDIRDGDDCEERVGKRGYIKVYGWRVAEADGSGSMFTSRCGLKKSGLSNASKHCSSGTVIWMAERVAYGNVQEGFKLEFKTSSSNRIKYTCSTCETGWKTNSTQSACDACDDSKNFVGSSGFCGCKKGYIYNIEQSKCVQNTNSNAHFSNTQNDAGEYYCAQGYTVTNMPTPTEANQYVRFVCGCNIQNGFTEDAEGCYCQRGYTIDDRGDNNPENDTCVLDINQVYVDSTGWFTIPGTGSCREDWWQQ